MVNLSKLGIECRKKRRYMGFSQNDVAVALNYSRENISLFERGNNDSVKIFLWYVDNCFTNWNEFCKLMEDVKQ